jgi:hypothetical protein
VHEADSSKAPTPNLHLPTPDKRATGPMPQLSSPGPGPGPGPDLGPALQVHALLEQVSHEVQSSPQITPTLSCEVSREVQRVQEHEEQAKQVIAATRTSQEMQLACLKDELAAIQAQPNRP